MVNIINVESLNTASEDQSMTLYLNPKRETRK